MSTVVSDLDALAALFEARAEECERARASASTFEDYFYAGEANAWCGAAYILRRTTLMPDFEKAARLMNETGQGEHMGVSK